MATPAAAPLGPWPWLSLSASLLFYFAAYMCAQEGHRLTLVLGLLLGSYFLLLALRAFRDFVRSRSRRHRAGQGIAGQDR